MMRKTWHKDIRMKNQSMNISGAAKAKATVMRMNR
jgi:hypothetical protein